MRAVALAVILAATARAGKLDLDLYSNVRPRFGQAQEAPLATVDRWLPGDPRNTRGQPFAVQALSDAGNAGLGAAGFAQNIGAAGKNREAAAMSAGFGAIAIINLWRSWKLWRDPANGNKDRRGEKTR